MAPAQKTNNTTRQGFPRNPKQLLYTPPSHRIDTHNVQERSRKGKLRRLIPTPGTIFEKKLGGGGDGGYGQTGEGVCGVCMYDLRVCPALFNLLTHTPYKILLKPINLKFYRLILFLVWVTVGKRRGTGPWCTTTYGDAVQLCTGRNWTLPWGKLGAPKIRGPSVHVNIRKVVA
jgi:hypothetical protein